MNQSKERHLFLTSSGLSESMKRKLFSLIGKTPEEVNVLYIPTAGIETDGAREGFAVCLHELAAMGILPEHILIYNLELIVSVLNKAGFVNSTRGKSGGYRLTRPASAYTVGEILRVTEGSLAPVSCLEDEHHCENCEDCVTYEIWQNVLDAINEVVDSITLSYLVEKQWAKKGCPCKKG